MDEGGDTDTTKTIVDNALNQANSHRATQQRWPWMLSRVYTFTTVAGQVEYILAEGALRLDAIRNATAKWPLEEVPDEMLVANNEDNGALAPADTARYFQKAGFSPIKQPLPAAGDTLTLTSSGTESASPTLDIEGENASGDFVQETLSVGGTSTNTYTRILYVHKSGGTPVGTLTLSSTGGLSLLVLTTSQYGKQYPIIRFIAPTNAGSVIQYRFLRSPRIMSGDGDLPDVPFPQCNILVWDALIMSAAYNEVDSEASNVWKTQRDNWEQNLLVSAFVGDTAAGWGEQVKLVNDI